MQSKIIRKGLKHHESHAAAFGDSKTMEQRLGCFPSLQALVGSSSPDGGKRTLSTKSSPNRDMFRRDLAGAELPTSRRPSMEVHMSAISGTTSRPRRSSITRMAQQQLDKQDDERGFLDRAFESAFTFDPDEQ